VVYFNNCNLLYNSLKLLLIYLTSLKYESDLFLQYTYLHFNHLNVLNFPFLLLIKDFFLHYILKAVNCWKMSRTLGSKSAVKSNVSKVVLYFSTCS